MSGALNITIRRSDSCCGENVADMEGWWEALVKRLALISAGLEIALFPVEVMGVT